MNWRDPAIVPAIIGVASNVRGGPNPPFTIEDFAEMYPQFFPTGEPEEEPDELDDSGTPPPTLPTDPGDAELTPVIPMVMMEAYLALAHASVKYSRFKDAWKVCMGFFIAHFITLYLETTVDPYGDAATLAKAGQAGGLMSSKSVDGVSVSYDFSVITNDMEGWGGWKATAFGVQFITFVQMFSMGGMYVR